MNFYDFKNAALKNGAIALKYDIKSDDNSFAKRIYHEVFSFYKSDPKNFSGDVIFTWKSPSLVNNGDYIGKRATPVNNNHSIGNLFPNFKTDRKYSLNLNRNGMMGDFPHDFIDIYLLHVAKYAFLSESDFVRDNIKEYYPLKRAIIDKRNLKFFRETFGTFEHYLEVNYFLEIWNQINIKLFSDMEYEEFKKVSLDLIECRGELMIKKIIEIGP